MTLPIRPLDLMCCFHYRTIASDRHSDDLQAPAPVTKCRVQRLGLDRFHCYDRKSAEDTDVLDKLVGLDIQPDIAIAKDIIIKMLSTICY